MLNRKRIKICKFCDNKDSDFNYKNEKKLRHFITERGKITPRRMTGTCAKHQRKLTQAIKRARYMAILPFTSEYIR
ncbi:MAG: 30S ribosomal protein S18 [Candidatus Latescibacteria bacterium]|nr:30S ribosomal protein S18 [Candidatus Latescibacterota bacterium]